MLDARIVATAVDAGAVLVRHRAHRIDVRDDVVMVDGEHAGRVLIAADGANSVLRRALGLPRNPDDHVAVAVRGYAAEHVDDGLVDRPPDRVNHRTDADRAQLIDLQDEAWPAYAWSFPLADGSGRANGRVRAVAVAPGHPRSAVG